MNDIVCIKKALENLGYNCEESTVAYGHAKSKIQGELVVRRHGFFDIAIVKDDDNYKITADWWKSDISEKDFAEQLAQEYTVVKIEKEINNSNKFRVIGNVEKLADGTQRIRITY